jgi:hypothetical protein
VSPDEVRLTAHRGQKCPKCYTELARLSLPMRSRLPVVWQCEMIVAAAALILISKQYELTSVRTGPCQN